MTWAYLPVLNECIKLLITIAIGSVLGSAGIFDAGKFVPQSTKFVFHVALPLLILGGIGIGVNFYENAFDLWIYILAFLLLRGIGLVLAIAWVVVENCCWGSKINTIEDDCDSNIIRHAGAQKEEEDTSIGRVAVKWLALTWISTVILGIPILTATFADPAKGKYYGLLAGVSSFIFQLPLQMFFLECHRWLSEHRSFRVKSKRSSNVSNALEEGFASERLQECPADKGISSNVPSIAPVRRNPEHAKHEAAQETNGPVREEHESSSSNRCTAANNQTIARKWREFSHKHKIWRKIWCKLLWNPVIWGIIGGFLLSLSTIGPRFLNPTSQEFIPGLGWIQATCAWFGACVSPVTLFTMGVWMQQRWKRSDIRLLRCHAASSMALLMLSKMVLMPLLMVGIAMGFHLNDEAGRAAVLIASLPISMASFSLSSHYTIGEAVLANNVALGTALMLPTVLVWNLVLDHVGVFPIAKQV
jgi:predicted permease